MQRIINRTIKRIFDIVASGLGLLLISPVLVLTALAVFIKLGRPILFAQIRPGKNEKPFTLYKFRTMSNRCSSTGELLPDGARLTPFGALLRKLSLDELPQLWNVFKGDMSFVGPRPLLMQYLPRYSKEQKRRHDVTPGITGWAQVNGRNTISWEDKFRYDVWYVDNFSLWLDVKIFFRTVAKVFAAKDISQKGQATMTEFMGSEE